VGLTSQISGMRVRLRLTLLYGVLFLLSGAVLLAITYLLVTRSGPNITMSTQSVTSSGGQESVSVFLGQTLPADSRLPQAIREQAVQQQAAIMHQLLVQRGGCCGRCG